MLTIENEHKQMKKTFTNVCQSSVEISLSGNVYGNINIVSKYPRNKLNSNVLFSFVSNYQFNWLNWNFRHQRTFFFQLLSSSLHSTKGRYIYLYFNYRWILDSFCESLFFRFLDADIYRMDWQCNGMFLWRIHIGCKLSALWHRIEFRFNLFNDTNCNLSTIAFANFSIERFFGKLFGWICLCIDLFTVTIFQTENGYLNSCSA